MSPEHGDARRDRTDLAPEARALLEAHAMEPIPQEGAWFAAGPRTATLNTITALLADSPDGFSALHRLDIDEGWIWLAGAPIRMLRLLPDGTARHDVLDAANRSVLVERGHWQGAATTGAWSLFACWCAPAFENHHFRLGDRAELVARHPGLEPEIRALTRDAGTEPGRARTP